MATRLDITQWRKRLERQGWVSLTRGEASSHRVIEYHVIWQGWLISGRVKLSQRDRHAEWWQPGSPTYLLERRRNVEEGVWRFCRIQQAKLGQITRRVNW